MSSALPSQNWHLTSTLDQTGYLRVALEPTTVTTPGPGEVLVAMEACPVHPADLMMLLPGVNPERLQFTSDSHGPLVTTTLPPQVVSNLAYRVGRTVAIGLEGAGTVVATGKGAEQLLGQRVAAMALDAGMFCQYRTLPAYLCTPLPEPLSCRDGAAAFSNPLTALAMVETLHQQGFNALIHTAAASSLGRMLATICREDGIPLVAVVRRPEQAALLREWGVSHVCDSSHPDFDRELTDAVADTGARVAFDAIGGGDMAHRLLCAMEAAAQRTCSDPFGSWQQKQVYIYGRLDKSLPFLNPSAYGGVWGVGGWAMPPILERAGPERQQQLRQRVLDNLTTTFATHYAGELSLSGLLQAPNLLACLRHATGEKYLLRPQYP